MLSNDYVSMAVEDRPVSMTRRFRPYKVTIDNGMIRASEEDIEKWKLQELSDIVSQDTEKKLTKMLLSLVEMFDDFENPLCLTPHFVNEQIMTDEVICRWCEQHGMPSYFYEYDAEAFRMKVQNIMLGICGHCAFTSAKRKYMLAFLNGIHAAGYRFNLYRMQQGEIDEGRFLAIINALGVATSRFPRINEVEKYQSIPESLILPMIGFSGYGINNILQGVHFEITYEQSQPYGVSDFEPRLTMSAADVFSALAYAYSCFMAERVGGLANCRKCGKLYEKTGNRSEYCSKQCKRRAEYQRRKAQPKEGENNEQASEQ